MKELKEAMKENKLIIGTERTIKGILNGKVKEVVIAKNCPEDIKKRIYYYSKIFGIIVKEFDGTNKDLGTFLGKPFGIAVVGIQHG